MALDGAFLRTIKNEIEAAAIGSRIDKIQQPSREELIFQLRSKGWSGKLLLSAGADSPRIHFTERPFENPKTPPMFCMFLRKHLSGAKLTAVRQLDMDRVLYLDFEATDELGDQKNVTVAVEIMGRHSNIIVICDGKVLDSIKRVDSEMSSVRPVLPGLPYVVPPQQGKLSLLEASDKEIKEAILAAKSPDLSKAIQNALEGFSSILAREAVAYAVRGQDADKNSLSADGWQRLFFFFSKLRTALSGGECRFTVVFDKEMKPKDFSFVDITQYGALMVPRRYDSASALLDVFYYERVRLERMKQRSNDLLRMLISTTERLSRKIALQKEELSQCGERDTLKKYGDLLSANFWRMKKGDPSVTLEDFYDEGREITIPLDPALTPVENAQKYYKEYRKAATAEKMLQKLIADGTAELTYVDSVFDAVSRTEGESELLEIRQELSEQGYLKNYRNKNKLLKAQPPLKYRTSDGYLLWCGRNNKQNDKLTLRDAKPWDIWFHTQGFAGSHVILVTDGKTLDELPDRTVEEAAMIAAYNSKARGAALVPVDYTPARNVKKPGGAKPGMVIFDHYYTLYTTPDEELVVGLAEK